MTYKRAPGTQICDFCGKEETEIEPDHKVQGWGTVEWRIDGPGDDYDYKTNGPSDDYDYKTKDLCPECLREVLDWQGK